MNNITKQRNSFFIYAALTILIILISGCNGDNTVTNNNNNQNLDTQLLIDNAGTIPVMNGNPTTSGIYIHNLGNSDIDNINYQFTNVDNKLGLINPTTCSNIKAYGSCLIHFTTPNLLNNEQFSSLLVAKYNNKQTKQILSYEYVNTNNYSGVSFVNKVIHLNHSHKYATVYAFNPSIKAIKTQLETNNNSVTITSNGLNGNLFTLEANSVIPIELKLSDTLYNKKTEIYNAVAEYSSLLQVVSDVQNRANILVSSIPVLNVSESDSTKVTILNNGTLQADNVSFLADNGNKISLTLDDPSCLNNGSLGIGASCTYTLKVLDRIGSENRNLYLNYHNGETQVEQTIPFTYKNSAVSGASLQIKPETTTLIMDGGESAEIKFIINNVGGTAFNNMQILQKTSLSSSSVTLNQAKSNCSNTLAAKGSCYVTVDINNTSYLNDNGIIYLSISGNSGATQTSKTFASISTRIQVIDKTQLILTDFRPFANESNVNTNATIELMFNKPVDTSTIPGNVYFPTVYLETPDHDKIRFDRKTVLNSKHIILFPDTKLNDNTEYSIVINQTDVLDLNGRALGESTAYIVAKFTTGDSTAPTILDFNPKNEQENMPFKSPNINILFSESMSLIDDSMVYLENTLTHTRVEGTSVLMESNQQLVHLKISTPLEKSTSYSLILDQTRISDKANNPLGTNAQYTLSTFVTSDGSPPEHEAKLITDGCARYTGNQYSNTCFSNTEITGGNPSNIKLNFTFNNTDDMKTIDKIELSTATQQFIAGQGFTPDTNTCQYALAPHTSCNITYRITSNAKTTPMKIETSLDDKFDYMVYYDNALNHNTLSADMIYVISIVNPTLTITPFNAQIKNATKVVNFTVRNLYHANLGTGNIRTNVVTLLNCNQYDASSNSQTCSATLGADPSTGNRTLQVTLWNSVVSTINYEVARLVFVSSIAYTGDMGGSNGPDSKCNTDANKPSGTTARAIITNSVNTTIEGARYFNRLDQFIAVSTRSDRLINPNEFLTNAIEPSARYEMWGSWDTGQDCNEWRSSNTSSKAIIGFSNATDGTWRDTRPLGSCTVARRLYCVTQ